MAKKPDATQHDRFVEPARQLSCYEGEAVFDKKLTTIARKKPKSAATK